MLQAQTKILGNRLSGIRQAGSSTQVDTLCDRWAESQQRNILARMVGRWRDRVATVIGRQNTQIARLQA